MRENPEPRRGFPLMRDRRRGATIEVMKEATSKVMIVGGGVAALEGLMALHELASDRVSLELVTPTPEFAYRPLAVAEPSASGRHTATTSCALRPTIARRCTSRASRASTRPVIEW